MKITKLIFIIPVIWTIYEKVTYLGVYRLAAEQQLKMHGQYSDKLSVLAAAIFYAAITVLSMYLLSKMFPSFNAAEIMNKEASHQETYRAYKLRRAKTALAIGLGVFVIMSLVGFTKGHFVDSSELPSMLIIDNNAEPKSSWVDVQGKAQMRYATEYSIKRGSIEEKYMVIPVTSADWKQGEQVKYFIRTKNMQLPDVQNKMHNVEKEQGAFVVKTEGIIEKNGLEGMVVENYKKHQFILTEPYYLIDCRKPTDKAGFIGRWAITSILVLVVFGGYAAYLFAQAKGVPKEM